MARKQKQKRGPKAQKAETKNNNNPQKVSFQPHPPANAGNKYGPKANSHARVPAAPKAKDIKSTTVPQFLNSKNSQTPSSPDANRKQETDMRIERSLTTNHTTGAALQQHSPTVLTPKTGASCSAPTKKASFLLLPPEIRWQIYQELFHTHRVEIVRRRDRKKKVEPRKPAPYRLGYRQLAPRAAQSQLINREMRPYPRPLFTPPFFPPFSPRTPLPTALIFTCRLTYCETIRLFYSNMQFVFRSIKAATRFMKTTSKDAQSAIKHVELVHSMYNEPRLTEFREYKFRSDKAWFLVCDAMSQSFEDLRVLHVHLAVHDWPIELEVGESWSFPLLVFGEHKPLLDFAKINLQMLRFDKNKLDFVSRSIEERLMKPEAFQIREDAKLARQLRGPLKARRILRIGF
ncbi:uncharacterized protein KD926_005740 [Aspergillus affinis]|uniref:uncharacterized protein n=1 Tax=Aspergillus affinis TaxID=1070780 RepID=UPI0022FF2624|nr:uncharacterized protein KD926_005740 [Aspergillus affinis]KAI9042240.1 hypothetical protein KD926_005740 [Aspergillus affinis]